VRKGYLIRKELAEENLKSGMIVFPPRAFSVQKTLTISVEKLLGTRGVHDGRLF